MFEMSLKLIWFSLTDAYGSPKFIGFLSVLRVIQMQTIGCKINCELEGLSWVSLDVYVFAPTNSNFESKKGMCVAL